MTSRTTPARPDDRASTLGTVRRGRHTATRIGLFAAVVLALMTSGLQPASAASKPGKVGVVEFVAKSYSRTNHSTTLSIKWPRASRAKKYEIFISRSYSMSKAKKYTTSARSKTIRHLSPGTDYFIQVRGVNGSKRGSKSNRVGHTTIRQFEIARGATYRVMTYNVCSRVCSGWELREPRVRGRINAFLPDVVAAQEADKMTAPAGYLQAHYKSGKRLLFKASRFTLEPGNIEGPTILPTVDTGERCTPTRTWGSYGEILLGYHGGGCRYAIWARLTDIATGANTMFVDVHTVSGDTSARAKDRRAEIQELTAQVAAQNPDALPVIYSGDFNSHKNRSYDYPRSVFNSLGYYDAFDLALSLRRQHMNSYNGFSTTPKVSYKWGDHLDKVWLRADQGRVLSWQNGAWISANKMVKPIPSDHSPIIVDLRIN